MDNPTRTYYKNGNIKNEIWYTDNNIHRLDGPAVIFYGKDGTIKKEFWYNDDALHRLCGPAIIWYNKDGNMQVEDWFIHNKQISPPYKNYPLTKEQLVEMKLKYG